MIKILLTIISISALIAVPSMSLLLSLKSGSPNFRELFQHKKILLRYILTMFIITPLLAIGFYYLVGPYNGLWIGVFVIAVSPVSPAVVKNMSKLAGDDKLTIVWMILTIFLSLIFVPLDLLLVESYFNLNIDLGISDVFIKLMVLFIIPMAAGFLIFKYLNKYVALIKKILEPVSKIAMLVLIIGLLIGGVPVIIKDGIIPVLLILAFIIVALTIAHFMGLPERKFGPVLAYSVILRLPAPAVILSQINDTVELHMPVILTFTILGTLVMIFYNKIFFEKADKN